jgi:hypothetical protein
MSRDQRSLEALMKVNKHLGIALAELSNSLGYVGSLREQRKLISVKLRLEDIITKTLAGEKWEKQRFFAKLKK